MRDRRPPRPVPAALCLAALALASCAHLRPEPPAPPPPPPVSGDLAAVECAGETPGTLAPAAGRILDPDAESIAAWLEALAGDGEEAARLRAFLRCVAERSDGGDRADARDSAQQARP